jgi:predicted ArsR family transcriptional regulator
MEPELKQALLNIEQKVDNVDKRLEKMEDRHEEQVKQIIENKMRTEELFRDLVQHKDDEAKFGRQFDQRIKDLEAKTWKLMLAASAAGLLGGGSIGSIF